MGRRWRVKVYIMGIDGYIGWALAQYLKKRGHQVGGCDSLLKRKLAKECKTYPVIPIESFQERAETS